MWTWIDSALKASVEANRSFLYFTLSSQRITRGNVPRNMSLCTKRKKKKISQNTWRKQARTYQRHKKQQIAESDPWSLQKMELSDRD